MFTLLNYSIVRDEIASVHRSDCGALDKDARDHAARKHGPYGSVADALDAYIDSEMEEMGWTREDVKVHACCRKAKAKV